MLTKCKIASVCLATIILALGCASNPDARKQAVLEKVAGIETELEALNDVFAWQWPTRDLNIQDDKFLRTMLSLEADDSTLYATTDTGLLFLVDFSRGRVRATYDAGSSRPITPPIVKGTYLDRPYLYLVHDNSIHAVLDGEGYLKAEWVKTFDGVVSTPLCETDHMIFFGARDQRVYALIKSADPATVMIRLIDHLDERIELAPVVTQHNDRAFFIDAAGDLYRFTGTYGNVMKPLIERLGPVDVPMLVDDQSNSILIATADYKLHAIDSRDGRTALWTRELGSKPVGALYIYNRAVYVVTDDAQLRAFTLDETPEAVAGKPLWNGAVVLDVKKIVSQGADNSLYVLRSDSRIAKLDAKTGGILWERRLPTVDFVVVNRYGAAIYLGIREGYIWALMPR
jgi:outer membrane protein assembly factor BamB